jgi:hypothetical protein
LALFVALLNERQGNKSFKPHLAELWTDPWHGACHHEGNMSFDFKVTPGPQHTRVILAGEATLGQLLSLLQVLQVDSAAWPRDAVLLDLSELRTAFTQAQRTQLQQEAVRRLERIQCVTVRWNPEA